MAQSKCSRFCLTIINFILLLLFLYYNLWFCLLADDVPNFPVDHTHLRPLRGRVSLARQVHMIEYRRDKARRADKWMSTTAESLGMELEDDLLYPTSLLGAFFRGW